MIQKLSIIVPVKNGEKHLRDCINAIISQMGPNNELIIVNNDSTDGTQSIIDSFTNDNIKSAFASPGSRGLARDHGIQISSGDIIVMLDSDCVAQPGWLDEIVSPILNLKQMVVVGKTIGPKSNSWGDIAQLADNRFLEAGEKNRYLDGFTATHFAVHRSSLSKLKFDPRFIAAEDFDFWLQCLNQSISIFYTPKAVVYHDYSNSLLVQLQKSYSRGFWTYQAQKQHSFRSLEIKNQILIKKGLQKRKLLYSLLWGMRRLVLFLILPNKKYIYETLYELTWQFSVVHSRVDFLIRRPSSGHRKSSFQ